MCLTRDRKLPTSSSSLRTFKKRNLLLQNWSGDQNLDVDSLVYLTGSDETKQTRVASRTTWTESTMTSKMKRFWDETSRFCHTEETHLDLLRPSESRMRLTCTDPDPRSAGLLLYPRRYQPPQPTLWFWLFNMSTLGAGSQIFQLQLPEISDRLSGFTSLMRSNYPGEIAGCVLTWQHAHLDEEYWSSYMQSVSTPINALKQNSITNIVCARGCFHPGQCSRQDFQNYIFKNQFNTFLCYNSFLKFSLKAQNKSWRHLVECWSRRELLCSVSDNLLLCYRCNRVGKYLEGLEKYWNSKKKKTDAAVTPDRKQWGFKEGIYVLHLKLCNTAQNTSWTVKYMFYSWWRNSYSRKVTGQGTARGRLI